MIFNEVAPQTPKNKVDKTTAVLSTNCYFMDYYVKENVNEHIT